MRNSRRHKLHRLLFGGEPKDHDEEELVRVVAGLRSARPVVPDELRQQVHSLRPTEPSEPRRRLGRWMPAALAMVAAACVLVASMLQGGDDAPPPSAARVLVAVDKSSGMVDERRVARSIDTVLADELNALRSSAGLPELVAIGRDGGVLLRISPREGDHAPLRKREVPLTSRYADTLRAAMTRPASRSDLGSAMTAAGRELQVGSQQYRRYLLILSDGLSADSRGFREVADRKDRAVERWGLAEVDLPDLRGVRVRFVDMGGANAGKPSVEAAARARGWLAWARAAGASVVR